jgi:hypothetical protein
MARWRGHTPRSGWICEMLSQPPQMVCRANAAAKREARTDRAGDIGLRQSHCVRNSRQVHLRGSEAFAALRASVARALPTERKWSKPAADSHAAPSTKTPE